FASLTGLGAAQGRTMSEVVPDLDASWREMLGAVARTAEPRHVVRPSQDGRRWLDAYATRIGDAKPIRIAILLSDVTDRLFADRMLAAEKTILGRVAADRPLSETLDTLTRQVEALSSEGMLCSVLLADASEQHLLHGAAPSLPEAYNRVIHGIRIGPGVG